MHIKHFKSSFWIKSGVFERVSSFTDLESRISQLAEEKDRGDVFEIFIEGYIATQPIAQCKEHWVVGSIPLALRERYNLPSDGTGIDGIYEATDGTHVAYQVKYRQKSNLTYQEVAPFLGLTERFTDRVIFTNAATLAHQAVARTRWVSRQDFLSLTPEALNEITSWIVGKPVERKRAEPDPRYQIQVLADIATALETNSRATVVMACGTGKTLVALWAVEQAKPKTVLVLLPSLSLVQQTVREWARHNSWGNRFSFVCVCSDATVAKGIDVLELDIADVGFKVDTDPATVNRFLAAPDDAVRVVFSTYQSSDVVAEGIKGLPPFDLAIFDEAHKTTGLAGGQFSRALSDDHIPIRKRLFFTATPRHIDIRSKRDRDGEYKVQSMDDPVVYGPRAHTLSFKAAADKGVICPYKVVISVVDKDLVDDFARKNGITLVDGDEVGVRWVSNLVALQQAIEQTGATKVITFHSRVKLADEFASDNPRGIGWFLDGFEVRHVNGKQRSSDRAELIKSFAESPKGIITNARCLTEGVDIPAVDMVAFIDPRQSRVDIAQAVGRAIRKPRGATKKTVGYVFVPLFLGSEGESIDDAIKSERFDAVADVLNALQEHDEELVDLIREAQRARGEGKPFKPRVLGDKVMMIGPRVELSRVVESVETRLVDTLGSSWYFYFEMLRAWRRENPERTPNSREEFNGASIGSWVMTQRSLLRRKRLSNEKARLMSEVESWGWRSPLGWNASYSRLKDYLEKNSNQYPSADVIYKDCKLGVWINSQRNKYREGCLAATRIALLEALGGWAWNTIDAAWELGFKTLIEYQSRYGNCLVPTAYKTSTGFRLGNWVGWQRNIKNNRLTVAQRRRLEGIPGWSWNKYDAAWDKGIESLRRYVSEYGDCLVPATFTDPTGFKLGSWMRVKRREAKMGRLAKDRLQVLSGFSGWTLDVAAQQWDEAYARLLTYMEVHGDTFVPAGYKHEDGFALGAWVNSQRGKIRSGKLDADKSGKLRALNRWADHLIDARWEENFKALLDYVERFKTSRVPQSFIANDGKKLGFWVGAQRRTARDYPERRARLEVLPDWFWLVK